MRKKGTLVISNPTGNVTYSISGLAIYSVSATATNATINGASSYSGTIQEGGTLTLTLGADGTNYKLPTSITVSGATGTFTRTSDTVGTLVISNPTGNVSFSVVGESTTWEETDLTGTTWRISKWVNMPIFSSSIDVSLIGKVSWANYDQTEVRSDGLSFQYFHNREGTGSKTLILNNHSSSISELPYYCFYNGFSQSGSNWQSHKTDTGYNTFDYVCVEFTGGEYVTNTTLITWLKNNATLTRW